MGWQLEWFSPTLNDCLSTAVCSEYASTPVRLDRALDELPYISYATIIAITVILVIFIEIIECDLHHAHLTGLNRLAPMCLHHVVCQHRMFITSRAVQSDTCR